MAKTVKINTEVIKNSLIISVDKALSKIENSYLILQKAVIPENYIYKNNLLKLKEQLYKDKQSLIKLKNNLNSIANKTDLENNIMLEDLQLINHFIITSKREEQKN